MTPLLSEKTTAKKSPPKQLVLAQQLLDILKQSRKIRHLVDVRRWESQFEILLNAHPSEEVAATLAWFAQNVNKEETPRVLSAKTFRLKYLELKQLEAGRPLSAKEISDDARKILDRYKDKGWAAGMDILLPTIIQRSLEKYRAFISTQKTPSPKNVGLMTAAQARGVLSSSPSVFVRAWLEDILAANFREWNGGAARLIFDRDSPRFQKMGRSVAYAYTHDSRRWDGLIQEVFG